MQYRWIGLAVLSFLLPTVLLADLDEITTLQADAALNLDTGVVSSSGGDLLWQGNAIAPQAGALLLNLGTLSAANFANNPQTFFVSQAAMGTSAAIASNLLAPGDVFVALTNGKNVAKILVLANSSGLITLQFTTFGGSAGPGVPTITQVLNNSSFVPFGASNYGIPPSSVFLIAGNNLADAGAPVLQSSAAPGLATTLTGASIAVVVNGVTTHPSLYYTSPTQLAAVIPAATPIGRGVLTVTYRGNTSAPAPIQVVPSALGINTYNTNTAVATDGITGALLTYTNSASPGSTIVLWITGLGANPVDSDTTYTASRHSLSTPLEIYIGGVAATILYQGSSGYPGVNQINVTIPSAVPPGCWVSLAAVSAGVLSNVATLPINPGGGACMDALSGFSGNQISPPDGQSIRIGLLALTLGNTVVDSFGDIRGANVASAAFEKYQGPYTPPSFVTPNGPSTSTNSVSPGGCIIEQSPPPVADSRLTGAALAVHGMTGLDPGAIVLKGPFQLQVTLPAQTGTAGAFYDVLPLMAIAPGGAFSFQVSGGADVGAFASGINLSLPLLTWTNSGSAASIDRTQGRLFTWMGGNPGTYVFISGYSISTALGTYGGFTCLAPVEAGQFTVPSYVLSVLPAGPGSAQLLNAIVAPFSAAGIDIGLTVANISSGLGNTYQAAAELQ